MSHAAEELWSSLPPGDDPPLEALADSHVCFVLDNTDLIELWYSEARHLPAAERQRQRRLQRRYIERWVTALISRRPDLERALGRTMVRGAIGLIHSVAHSEDRRDPDDLREVLVRMALTALDTTMTATRGDHHDDRDAARPDSAGSRHRIP